VPFRASGGDGALAPVSFRSIEQRTTVSFAGLRRGRLTLEDGIGYAPFLQIRLWDLASQWCGEPHAVARGGRRLRQGADRRVGCDLMGAREPR
jgi:hypothetical protein